MSDEQLMEAPEASPSEATVLEEPTDETLQQIWDRQLASKRKPKQEPAPPPSVPESELEQAAEPEPMPEPEPEKPKHNWEKRYKDTARHVTAVEQENKQLREQVLQMQTQQRSLQDEMAKRIEQIESQMKAAKPGTAEPVEDPQEEEDFFQDFPQMRTATERLVKQHLEKTMESLKPVQETVSSLQEERAKQQQRQQLLYRYDLANQQLGISNSRQIDGSNEFGQWVSQSPHRLAMAKDFGAAEDFVELIRAFLASHPAMAQSTAPAPEVQEEPARPRPVTAARTPNAPTKLATRPKKTEDLTEADLQSIWNEQLQARRRQQA